jgi:hypothetical protein
MLDVLAKAPIDGVIAAMSSRKRRGAALNWRYNKDGSVTLTYRGKKKFRGEVYECKQYAIGWNSWKGTPVE